jgi:hypothetical protein
VNKLPNIGRPSLTGLSVKQLGRCEYHRRYWRLKHPAAPRRNWWTGLSPKEIGATEYMRRYRALKKKFKPKMKPNRDNDFTGLVVTFIIFGALGQLVIWLAGKLGELSTQICP